MKYDPSQSTAALIKKASQLFIRLATEYLKKENIAHAYTPFLVHLWQEDGQTQAVLHRKIGIEQPTAVRTLDRMERDGLIKRVRSETDRREIRIYLTKKAEKLKPHVISCGKRINEIARQGLDKKDIAILHQLLEKLVENLEKNLLPE